MFTSFFALVCAHFFVWKSNFLLLFVGLFDFPVISSTNLLFMDCLSALKKCDLVYLGNQWALGIYLLNVFHLTFFNLTWIFFFTVEITCTCASLSNMLLKCDSFKL